MEFAVTTKMMAHNGRDTDDEDSHASSHAQSKAWMEEKYFCKMSKHVDFVAENETFVGKTLTTLNHVNVVKWLGSEEREFMGKNNERYTSIVTLWEKLTNLSLAHFIEDETIADHVVAACIVQVLCCVLELQELVGFVHGDLHTSNVLVQRTSMTLVHYFDKTVQVPTYGYVVKIIDFGYSHLWKVDKSVHMSVPLYTFGDGVVNMWFDPLFDWRIFCEAVSLDLFNCRKTKFVGNFQRLTVNLLATFTHKEGKVIPKKNVYMAMVNQLQECMQSHEHKFLCDATLMADMFGALITFPLEADTTKYAYSRSDYDKVNKFLAAWANVEQYLTAEQAYYFLKNMVKFVRQYDDGNQRRVAVHSVERKFNNFIHEELAKSGQNMVPLTHTTTSILYHSFVVASNSLQTVLLNNVFVYKELVESYTHAALVLLRRVGDNNQDHVHILLHLLAYWYNSL